MTHCPWCEQAVLEDQDRRRYLHNWWHVGCLEDFFVGQEKEATSGSA